MRLFVTADASEEKGKFEILYENYRFLMHRVAMDVLRDRYLAEDAVQNAFIRLAGNMDRIGEPEELRTKRYLITAVKRAAIDLYRKRNGQMAREIFVDELDDENTPVTYLETDVENRVLDVLKNLPEKYRDIFLLKYSSHMENEEIARICGLQEGTVRQRIARGKALIEKELEKMEGM